MFNAKVILDSIGQHNIRLISVEATYPRFIHSELLTHRDRARNSASSRAIPYSKMRERVLNNPVVPVVFGKEQKGMQTGDCIEGEDLKIAQANWHQAMENAVKSADILFSLGVHKSICNRLVEPFMWMTTLFTATEWNNFFRLRIHPDAEIHFQIIAQLMKRAIDESTPQQAIYGDWHLPYIQLDDYQNVYGSSMFKSNADRELALRKISAGRCARLSYLTHDGNRDIQKDIELCDRLINRSDNVIHASPLEHVARCTQREVQSGPFRGWAQFRKEFQNENVVG